MGDRLYRLWMRRLQDFLATPPVLLSERDRLSEAPRAG
jgi:hypothetical protein